jgi:hypothetical protein
MCPMLAKPNEIAMLSVKKKHPLGGNCDSRRRNCSRCTNLRQLLTVERNVLRRVLIPGTKLKSTNHERILLAMQFPHVLQSWA